MLICQYHFVSRKMGLRGIIYMENVVISAFSNPVRLKLLCCLSKGKRNVNDLIGNCGLAQSAVSQHLTKLKKAGLVKDEKIGKYVYYSLTHPKTGRIAHDLNIFLKEIHT